MFKLGTKNVLFGYFWTKMAYLDIFWAKINKTTIAVFEIGTLEFA